ncbi:MAG: hypothetical protein LBK29_02200 [Oscillospiraceae bacterium]|jgi:hypothetical protein|nr:hypothetical protein [Oscillospiraceae bacterium]
MKIKNITVIVLSSVCYSSAFFTKTEAEIVNPSVREKASDHASAKGRNSLVRYMFLLPFIPVGLLGFFLLIAGSKSSSKLEKLPTGPHELPDYTTKKISEESLRGIYGLLADCNAYSFRLCFNRVLKYNFGFALGENFFNEGSTLEWRVNPDMIVTDEIKIIEILDESFFNIEVKEYGNSRTMKVSDFIFDDKINTNYSRNSSSRFSLIKKEQQDLLRRIAYQIELFRNLRNLDTLSDIGAVFGNCSTERCDTNCQNRLSKIVEELADIIDSYYTFSSGGVEDANDLSRNLDEMFNLFRRNACNIMESGHLDCGLLSAEARSFISNLYKDDFYSTERIKRLRYELGELWSTRTQPVNVPTGYYVRTEFIIELLASITNLENIESFLERIKISDDRRVQLERDLMIGFEDYAFIFGKEPKALRAKYQELAKKSRIEFEGDSTYGTAIRNFEEWIENKSTKEMNIPDIKGFGLLFYEDEIPEIVPDIKSGKCPLDEKFFLIAAIEMGYIVRTI